MCELWMGTFAVMHGYFTIHSAYMYGYKISQKPIKKQLDVEPKPLCFSLEVNCPQITTNFSVVMIYAYSSFALCQFVGFLCFTRLILCDLVIASI